MSVRIGLLDVRFFVTAVLIQGMIWLLFQYFSGRESLRLTPQYPLAAGQETRRIARKGDQIRLGQPANQSFGFQCRDQQIH